MKKQFLLTWSLFMMIFGVVLAQDRIPGTIPQNAGVQTPRAPETSGLNQLYSVTGQYYLSADGGGANANYSVDVNKPSALATVHKAYLMSATIWNGGSIANGCITLNGSPVNWDGSTSNALPGSYTYYTDVTSLVASALNPAAPGITSLPVTECNTFNIDGVALLVIFADPTATEETIVILFGAQAFAGDTFSIALAESINPADPGAILNMGLGISYSYQIGGVQQYSIININGARLTTSAGGEDDGSSVNGALMTVGGLGDSNSNPTNPNATPTGPRSDDELYSLLPFIDIATTNITAFTSNPSNDDNIFLAYFEISGAAIIGEGILLSQTTNSPDVGTDHTIKALIQNSQGNPVAGKMVDFEVTSGPNSGLSFSAATNGAGEAFFVYNSSGAGVDIVMACFENSQNATQCSNALSVNWTLSEGESIELSQALNNQPLGETHTVTATVQDEDHNPMEGVSVDFEVITGPNTGNTFTALTDVNGEAFYSYVGYVPGVDQIQACFENSLAETQCSNVLNFQWTGQLVGYQVCIPKGWSIISSPYEPFDPNFETIFSQIVADNKLVILLNRGGFWWPSQNINLLGEYNTNNAYKVKMNEAGCALFSEVPLTDLSVTLAKGIDYLPVLVDENVDAAGFFAQLAGNLLYAFDIHNGLVFWPAGGIFTLNTLQPGVGYLVSMTENASATYDFVTDNSNFNAPVSSFPANSPWNINRSGDAHLISISSQSLSALQAGDFVGVFTNDGVCAGVAEVKGDDNLLLVAYGDDITTSAIDGFIENNTLNFKVYRQSDHNEYAASVTFDAAMANQGQFVINGQSKVIKLALNLTGVVDNQLQKIDIFPNPGNGRFNVQINGLNTVNTIQVTNLTGKTVYEHSLVNQSANSMFTMDLSNLSKGVYFVKFLSNNGSTVQKIVIQ